MKILYAGDSPAGGAANYLLGVMRSLKADLKHLSPSEILKPAVVQKKFDVIVFSDFSKKQVPAVSEKMVVEQIKQGAGFLMVGGWGSFSGPFGGWQGSLIESILPVSCAKTDDRMNFPGGAVMTAQTPQHPIISAKTLAAPPVICGMNRITPKKQSKVLLTANPIKTQQNVAKRKMRMTFERKGHPLLVVDSNPGKRIAAFATDFAPHWCGGLVDWGKKVLKLSVNSEIQIQVGDYYVDFIASLLRWLAREK